MPATPSPAAMLERLVAFDTTSRNPNDTLIAFCAAWFAEHGADVIRVPGDEPGKVNLYATFGPMVPGGVVLSGHTDVVPVDGQDWSTDPWALTAKDGRLYGRGTADMKGFCATVMALAPRFAAARLKRPIHVAFSYDEEVGCLGVRPLLAHLTAHLPKPELAIIGEPTMMRPVNAHKGVRNFEVTVTGRESHSSAVTKGVNAVMIAAELITALKAMGDELSRRGDPSGRFDPPFTSIACNMIAGGTAMNITAGECRFHYEVRDLPYTDDGETIPARFAAHCRDVVLPRMRAVAAETGIAIQAKSWIPGLAPEPGNPAEALVLQLTGQNRGEAVAYGTEAGLFREAGIPAVVCGPGDIAQAHAPDEFIAASQLDACADFLEALVRRLES